VAVLIPAIGVCKFDSTGERRLAERLEQKLDSDYLLWHNVPVGPKRTYPDFVVIHPRRGALILETKDWRIETIAKATKQYFEIHADGALKTVVNPLAQARHCALQVVNALDRDKQLVHADGPHRGKLIFPWGYGVVLTRITRSQFDLAGLGDAMEPHLVICQDEMLEAVDAEEFQQRLWDMFPHAFGKALSLPQLDRVRWIMFPEVRVSDQAGLFDSQADAQEETDLPDLMRVMDLQQEQLARSLGEGHRVIHGVAGSGKTMILGYRAQQLAQAAVNKPILVLCYNEPLAVKLDAMMAAKGLRGRVHVRNFHKWCRHPTDAGLDGQRALLREVEVTSMTKSFKAVPLESFLELNGLTQPPLLATLAERSWAVLLRRPALLSDLPGTTRSLDDPPRSPPWSRHWRDNPVNAWIGGISRTRLGPSSMWSTGGLPCATHPSERASRPPRPCCRSWCPKRQSASSSIYWNAVNWASSGVHRCSQHDKGRSVSLPNDCLKPRPRTFCLLRDPYRTESGSTSGVSPIPGGGALTWLTS